MLGIRFKIERQTLHIFYPSGQAFFNSVELYQYAEKERQRAEAAEQNVEQERQEKEAALAEIERLRALLPAPSPVYKNYCTE